MPQPDAVILPPESGAIHRPGLLSLGWAPLSIGAVAFGGLGATLALLRRELVERRGWLRPSDIAEALAYTKSLPSWTVVQVVTFLGWRLGNWRGAIVVTVAFLLPALALMTVAAAAVMALPDAPWVLGALTGLQVAVVGLLAAALWHLARSEAGSALHIVIGPPLNRLLIPRAPPPIRPSVSKRREVVEETTRFVPLPPQGPTRQRRRRSKPRWLSTSSPTLHP